MTDSEKDLALAHYTALAEEAGANPVAHATATANPWSALFPVRFTHPRLGIYETESSYRARFAKWWMTGVPDRIPVRRDAGPREAKAVWRDGRCVALPLYADAMYRLLPDGPWLPYRGDTIPLRRDAEPHVDAWRWPTFGATLLRRPRYDLLWRRVTSPPRPDAPVRRADCDGKKGL